MKNEKHSFQDYTGRTFLADDPANWAGEIVGACFGHETPDTEVFPPGTVCTLERCNLSNVAMPPGCTIGEGCQTTRFRVQADGEDWVVDDQGNPIEPLDKKRFEEDGESTDPADIGARVEAAEAERARIAAMNAEEIAAEKEARRRAGMA